MKEFIGTLLLMILVAVIGGCIYSSEQEECKAKGGTLIGVRPESWVCVKKDAVIK